MSRNEVMFATDAVDIYFTLPCKNSNYAAKSIFPSMLPQRLQSRFN